MKLDTRKKSKLDGMVRSNSFDTQEAREAGRTKADESRDFLILLSGMKKELFQMYGMEIKIFFN